MNNFGRFTRRSNHLFERGIEVSLVLNRKQRSQLLHIFIAQVEGWEVASLASFGSYEDTVGIAARKVPLALDCAVVLARGLVQRDSDPNADSRNLRNQSNV